MLIRIVSQGYLRSDCPAASWETVLRLSSYEGVNVCAGIPEPWKVARCPSIGTGKRRHYATVLVDARLQERMKHMRAKYPGRVMGDGTRARGQLAPALRRLIYLSDGARCPIWPDAP
jgi:hypothetical protein